MIDARTLAEMKTRQQAAMPDSCVVKRLTRASDGAGGSTESWATAATVACRYAPARGAEQQAAGKLAAVGVWTVTVPQGTDVRATDRLVIGTRTFEVVTTAAGSVDGAWETALRVLATEVT